MKATYQLTQLDAAAIGFNFKADSLALILLNKLDNINIVVREKLMIVLEIHQNV